MNILSNIWFDTNVRVRSLHERVTLGLNMLAHAHAKVKEHGVLVLGNSYMYIFWLSGPCFPSPCRKDPSLVLCSSCKAVKDCYWLRLLCRSIQKSIKDIRFFMCKAYICSEKKLADTKTSLCIFALKSRQKFLCCVCLVTIFALDWARNTAVVYFDRRN